MLVTVLEELFERTDGIIMVSILGMDGLPIERVIRPKEECPAFEEELLSAQYSTLFKNVASTNVDIGLKGTREVIVATDEALVVINRINEDFLVVSLLSADGNLGRARYENRKAAIKLQGHL
jgi:predicted regulator of Ras-like GTPase activity (Roadblock/LC7/MglB family)